jgi:FixJ family two-component response regulator
MQIAVVSGMQDPHSAEQALTAGADRFFIKPMRISELCDDIIDMMENGATALET